MRVRMAVNNRVLVVKEAEERPYDEAKAMAQSIIDGQLREERVWAFAKQSFVPALVLLMALVL